MNSVQLPRRAGGLLASHMTWLDVASNIHIGNVIVYHRLGRALSVTDNGLEH
jgi:hypothetical protein